MLLLVCSHILIFTSLVKKCFLYFSEEAWGELGVPTGPFPLVTRSPSGSVSSLQFGPEPWRY